MDFENWYLYIFSIILFTWLGYYFLTNKIVDDFDINNPFATMMFCFNFAFSVNSLLLMLFEICQFGSNDSR